MVLNECIPNKYDERNLLVVSFGVFLLHFSKLDKGAVLIQSPLNFYMKNTKKQKSNEKRRIFSRLMGKDDKGGVQQWIMTQ